VKTVIGLIVAAVLFCGTAAAQQENECKPGQTTPCVSLGTTQNPQVSPQDKQTLNDLQLRAFGYAQSIATLQKELDAVNAEFGRTVQRLQSAQPGYELSQALTYVKKPEPKKDEAKSTSPPK
jgi:hypothetical protein